MEPIVIILIVLGLLALGGIIFYFFKKNQKISDEVEPTSFGLDVSDSVTGDIVVYEEQKKTEEQIFETIKNEILTSKEIEKEESLENTEEVQANVNIASKTEKILLKKLELFEKNKGFIKKDVNLTTLAKQFETNTKYLSEIIKTYRQKQFNMYLNELRINYIVDRLQNEPKYINTKVSYLASDCGFTSHSTFTTIFTQIMNESPSVFIKRIKAEKE